MEKAWGISQCTTFHLGLYIWKHKELNKFGVFIWIEDFIWIIYSAGHSKMPKLILSILRLRFISSSCILLPKNAHFCWPDQGQSRDDTMLCISPWAPLLTPDSTRLGKSLTWAYFALCDTEDEGSQDLLVTPLFYWWTNTFEMAEKPSCIIQHHLDIFNTLLKRNILFCFAFLETPCIPLKCQN